MASTVSIRAATKRRLRDLLEQAAPARLDGRTVPVLVGNDGRNVEDVCYIVGDVTGDVNVPAFQGPTGRLYRDDTFTVDVLCMARTPSDSSQLEADERAEELYIVLDDLLAEDPSLDELDGIQWAVLSRVDGPNAVEADASVWTSAMRVTIEVHARAT